MFTLSHPLIYDNERIYFLAYSASESGTRVFRWTHEWNNYFVPFKTCGITALRGPAPAVVVLGIEGSVHFAGPDGFLQQSIDSTSNGPLQRGILRDVCVIENEIYAVGLGRQVYKRNNLGIWNSFVQNLVQNKETDSTVAGFESIAGFDKNEIYAVGMLGDLYLYQEGQWASINLSTNLILTKVFCAADGFVYIAGQDGVLFKGRKQSWEKIEQNITTETFWDICWFDNAIWLSTLKGIFRLDSQEKLKYISIPGTESDFRYLSAYHEVLVASGGHQICIYKSGMWTKLQMPG